MEREPLTHFIYVNLSAKDRQVLEQIAEARGATLSGVIRRWIRDAAPDLPSTDTKGEQYERATQYAASR